MLLELDEVALLLEALVVLGAKLKLVLEYATGATGEEAVAE